MNLVLTRPTYYFIVTIRLCRVVFGGRGVEMSNPLCSVAPASHELHWEGVTCGRYKSVTVTRSLTPGLYCRLGFRFNIWVMTGTK